MTSLPPYRHVAVALDGSECALRALPVARGAADVLGADLWLVSVAGIADARDRFARARGTSRGVVAREIALGGADVAAALGRFDRENPETLLCMSTRGRGGLGRSLLGAVARDVVRRSDQATLLVGPSCRQDLEGLSGLLIVCLDGTPGGETVLPWAERWARSSGLPLGSLRVAYPLAEPEAQHAEMAYGERTTRQLEEAGHRVIDLSQSHTEPALAIVETAARLPGAIVAMASTARHPLADAVLGSTTSEVLKLSPAPVLLVSGGP